MVIIMETRMERTKRRKKEKRKKFFRRFIVYAAIALLFLGLIATEKAIKDLSRENTGKMFFIDLGNGEFNIQLFGKNYNLNYFKEVLNKIYKKVLKWPVKSGHLIYIYSFFCYNCLRLFSYSKEEKYA